MPDSSVSKREQARASALGLAWCTLQIFAAPARFFVRAASQATYCCTADAAQLIIQLVVAVAAKPDASAATSSASHCSMPGNTLAPNTRKRRFGFAAIGG